MGSLEGGSRMNFTMIALFNVLENIAIVAGVTIATIHFERPALLWFLLLVVVNQRTMRRKGEEAEP